MDRGRGRGGGGKGGCAGQAVWSRGAGRRFRAGVAAHLLVVLTVRLVVALGGLEARGVLEQRAQLLGQLGRALLSRRLDLRLIDGTMAAGHRDIGLLENYDRKVERLAERARLLVRRVRVATCVGGQGGALVSRGGRQCRNVASLCAGRALPSRRTQYVRRTHATSAARATKLISLTCVLHALQRRAQQAQRRTVVGGAVRGLELQAEHDLSMSARRLRTW